MGATKPIEEIKPKDELKGTVAKIELAGAFIDIGTDQPALLHISQIRAGRVNNVQDHLKEGQEVTVWVRDVDAERGRISLTMIKPPAVTWDEIKVGQTHTGNVVRIEKFGVFVDIGAERPGLVHVSELDTDYVERAEDVVKMGETVEVKVIGVNARKNQIDLSIKALDMVIMEEINNEDDDEEAPTAFALALQRAQAGEDSSEAEGSQRVKASKKANAKQEEVLKRTLERHMPENN